MPQSENENTAGKWVLGIVAACAVVVFSAWLTSTRESDRETRKEFNQSIRKVSDKIDALSIEQSQTQRGQIVIQKDVEWIKRSVGDVYSRIEAEKEHARIERRNQSQDTAISSLHKRMSRIEARRRAN